MRACCTGKEEGSEIRSLFYLCNRCTHVVRSPHRRSGGFCFGVNGIPWNLIRCVTGRSLRPRKWKIGLDKLGKLWYNSLGEISEFWKKGKENGHSDNFDVEHAVRD